MTETMSPVQRRATDRALGNQRLLDLADLLDRYDGLYDQRGSAYGGDGNPPCAAQIWRKSTLGTDLENVSSYTFFDLPIYHELDELFGFTGCGNARSAKQAATYIRGFVARRQLGQAA